MPLTKLKLTRLNKDLKLIEVSRMTKIHPTTISLLEHGAAKPTAKQKEKLCRVLAVPEDQLFGEVQNEEKIST